MLLDVLSDYFIFIIIYSLDCRENSFTVYCTLFFFVIFLRERLYICMTLKPTNKLENTSAVKWLITSKIKVFVYIIYVCVCTVYIYYVYINAQT